MTPPSRGRRGLIDYARASRMFVTRAVRYLAHEAGVRQFLDIGAGLPVADNTHEVAQREAPECRIVYADNDPMVVAHARARLTSSPEGAIDYRQADLRDPNALLRSAARTLDFTQPVALMLMGVLGHITDDGEVLSIVRRLLDALPSGSYLARYDGTSTDETFEAAQDDYDDTGAVPYRLRIPEQIAESFAGLELVEPGVVSCPQWRPDTAGGEPDHVDSYCGVGLKP